MYTLCGLLRTHNSWQAHSLTQLICYQLISYLPVSPPAAPTHASLPHCSPTSPTLTAYHYVFRNSIRQKCFWLGCQKFKKSLPIITPGGRAGTWIGLGVLLVLCRQLALELVCSFFYILAAMEAISVKKWQYSFTLFSLLLEQRSLILNVCSLFTGIRPSYNTWWFQDSINLVASRLEQKVIFYCYYSYRTEHICAFLGLGSFYFHFRRTK